MVLSPPVNSFKTRVAVVQLTASYHYKSVLNQG